MESYLKLDGGGILRMRPVGICP